MDFVTCRVIYLLVTLMAEIVQFRRAQLIHALKVAFLLFEATEFAILFATCRPADLTTVTVPKPPSKNAHRNVKWTW